MKDIICPTAQPPCNCVQICTHFDSCMLLANANKTEEIREIAQNISIDSVLDEMKKDAERFVFQYTNFGAMLEIEHKAIRLSPKEKPESWLDWYRAEIDAAIEKERG